MFNRIPADIPDGHFLNVRLRHVIFTSSFFFLYAAEGKADEGAIILRVDADIGGDDRPFNWASIFFSQGWMLSVRASITLPLATWLMETANRMVYCAPIQHLGIRLSGPYFTKVVIAFFMVFSR